MHRRAAAGYADTVASVAKSEWFDIPGVDVGLRSTIFVEERRNE